jgi:nitroreductase
MTTNDALELVRKRRTIRRFTAEDVSEELVDTLLEAASVAPSRLDQRPLHYVIIRDKAIKAKIAEALRVRPYLEQAPVVVAVAANPDISPTWALDASAAIENMLLAAASLGLGTAWVGSKGSTMWDRTVQVLREKLAIPEDIDVVSLVCIGYPDEDKPAYEPGEKRDPHRLHYDHWDNLKLS